MKFCWFAALLLLMNCAASAAETAYEALRALARARGQSVLNRVLEVRGARGAPQPTVWTIVVDDTSARGGVREFQISRGQVVGERAPSRDSVRRGTVMNFKRLNLDSDGAFTVADQEAAKAKVAFDRVDYELRSETSRQIPVWLLQLTDTQGDILQNLALSADTGAVLRRNASANTYAGPPRGDGDLPPDRTDRSVRTYDRRERPLRSERRDRYDDLEDDNEGDLGHEINKHLHRGAATVQEWITGRRTWDRKYEGEP